MNPSKVMLGFWLVLLTAGLATCITLGLLHR
jgi:hypothetical protein